MKICVIGLGEIGSRTFNKMRQIDNNHQYIGVDKDPTKFGPNNINFPMNGARTQEEIDKAADVYIISVWNSQQVLDVLKLIPWKERPLVCIESTFDPGMIRHVPECSPDFDPDCLVAVPHRFNPNDAEHDVFNLVRVLGGMTPVATERGYAFYLHFMNRRHIYKTSFKNAVLTKVAENAYRYMEIVIAQEIKRCVESKGYNFEEIRLLMNSKWNIDVKQALGGVQGKCLPKDMNIFTQNFLNDLFEQAIESNENYIGEIANGRISPSYGMQRSS